MWLALLPAAMALALATSGCSRRSEPTPDVPPKTEKRYPSGADGLKSLWTDILEAARRDERGRVHDLLASMIMTDADLAALFGAERGGWLKPRYQPMISRVVNLGAIDLVGQVYERKYDDVEVFAVDGKGGSPTDVATVAALPAGTPIYGVRVKRKAETKGLRYDFFVFREGRWITGNQIAQYLVPPPTDAGPAALTRAAVAPAPTALDPGQPPPAPRRP